MANPLQQLAGVGQSFWLDNLSRTIITSGELMRLIQEDGLRGITSNPTIFEKALAGTDAYDQDITRLAAQGKTVDEIFEGLAVEDIRMAADLLRPVFDATGGGDGFVSLELPPSLSADTAQSVTEAQRLFAEIGRPNVLIKVPGTPEGIPAVEELIALGINVNITLLFSLDGYQEVMEAYLRGLERRVAQDQPVHDINSVASFFVSRVDTEVDHRIEQLLAKHPDEATRRRLTALQGKAAIANAKIAYQRFKQVFLEGERFARLRERGARLQRPLWASTSTKNPAYSDIYYIEALIGPHTVDTMPDATAAAFRDHGRVRVTIEDDIDEARRVLDELGAVGISYDDVTQLLQVNGVAAFAKSYDSLIKGIDEKRHLLLGPTGGRPANLGPFDEAVRSALDDLSRDDAVARIWRHDAALWGADPTVQQSVANRLGWLSVHETMLGELRAFADLQADVRQAGFTRALLLGMGGSSLAPEVFQQIFGNQVGFPELVVVDTTDPDAIAAVTRDTDLDHALFIVSSKSGTTVETSSLFAHFDRLLTQRVGAGESARHFVAITDPGTRLEQLARDRGFRHLFLNPADIGGRYSALSYFGLVPAAVIGLDVTRLLDGAAGMAERLKAAGDGNPGLWLGGALGALAQAGHDKVTFVFDPALDSLASWLEQLLAESTGKDGTGLVPVAHEPHAPLESYGADRVFVGLDLVPQPHARTDAFLDALERAGQPVIRLRMADEWQLGAEFLRWELATAVAGVVLGINPFDEPNVQESKDNTNRLLAEYQRQRALPEPPPAASTAAVSVVGVTAPSVPEAFEDFVGRVHLGDYLAIMAFMERTADIEDRLQEIRGLLCERLGVATTLGFGPRFLHSTGQLYKGGPATGTFLQIVAEPRDDLPIPGQDYSFGTLFRAQSLGDYQALRGRGRPLLRLTVSADPVEGLREILRSLVPAAAR